MQRLEYIQPYPSGTFQQTFLTAQMTTNLQMTTYVRIKLSIHTTLLEVIWSCCTTGDRMTKSGLGHVSHDLGLDLVRHIPRSSGS